MAYQLARRTFGGFILLCAGCGGRDALLTTGGAGAVDMASASSAGTSSVTGTGGSGGSASPAPTGWIAFDADYGGLGRHIQVVAADGSCSHPLTRGSNQEKQAAWSADGQQLAFRLGCTTGKFQIYTLDLRSGEQIQVTHNEDDDATYPSWSPDGKSIAFVTGDPEQNANATNFPMVLDIDTGKSRTVAPVQQPPYTWSTFATNKPSF